MIGPQVTPEAFAALDPDMRLLAAIDARGISVTCKEDGCFTQGKRWYFPHFFFFFYAVSSVDVSKSGGASSGSVARLTVAVRPLTTLPHMGRVIKMMAVFCVMFCILFFKLFVCFGTFKRRGHFTTARHCTFAVCTALAVALLYGDDVTNTVTVNAQFS